VFIKYILIMKCSIYYDYGALNSRPVFDAVAQGLRHHGHTVVAHDDSADIAIIWSQLWAGRMRANQTVWHHYKKINRPVLVVEVGALQRDQTWRLMLDGKNCLTSTNNTSKRFNQLGLQLHPWRQVGDHIVVACQRPESQQWTGMPAVAEWVDSLVAGIRQVSSRPIHIRPHPRHRISTVPNGCYLDQPRPQANTYDDYDLARSLNNAWCVVNYNSNPAVSAVLSGYPVFVHSTSIAAAVGNLDLAHIERPLTPDREQWAWDLAHTEWTVAEIATGAGLEQLSDLQKIQ